MHRVIVAAILAAVALTANLPAQAQEPCRFVLGFAALRDAIGAQKVGACLEDERFNLENGNAEQRTSGGLLVWRKIDNFTAFTDGGTSWINGPNGLQSRPNSERFSWERDPVQPGSGPAASTSDQPPAPSATPTQRTTTTAPAAPTSTPQPTATPRPDPPRNAGVCCRTCTTGKACGDSCISRALTCRVGSGCACNGEIPSDAPPVAMTDEEIEDEARLLAILNADVTPCEELAAQPEGGDVRSGW